MACWPVSGAASGKVRAIGFAAKPDKPNLLIMALLIMPARDTQVGIDIGGRGADGDGEADAAAVGQRVGG